MERVAEALRDPASLASAGLAEWELLVRQARAADVLGTLAVRVASSTGLDSVPAAPRRHLRSALLLAEAQRATVARELDRIAEALAQLDAPVAVLKGTAYLLGGHDAARGRMFGDVDILVPRERLQDVESALMLHGWATTHLDAYDQRYYREWMHELPPMMHVSRGTVLDVHHAILPPTGRAHPDSAALFAAARPARDDTRFLVLAPRDLVLHSAAHLFYNEEFTHGLRDLWDLDCLLREFRATPEFGGRLAARAGELGLVVVMRYALRYVERFFGTRIDGAIPSHDSRAQAIGLRCMDTLFERALRPDHATAALPLTGLAKLALYVRGHWLRMPPPLLVRHLAVKAWRRRVDGERRQPAN